MVLFIIFIDLEVLQKQLATVMFRYQSNHQILIKTMRILTNTHQPLTSATFAYFCPGQ